MIETTTSEPEKMTLGKMEVIRAEQLLEFDVSDIRDEVTKFTEFLDLSKFAKIEEKETQKMPSLLTSTVTLPDTSPGTTQSIWDVERHTAATGNPSPNLHDNSRDATKPEPRTVTTLPPPLVTFGATFSI